MNASGPARSGSVRKTASACALPCGQSKPKPVEPLGHVERGTTRSSSCKNVFRSSISRSEEHTSELQSRLHLVCRLLLEKKKKRNKHLLQNGYTLQSRRTLHAEDRVE